MSNTHAQLLEVLLERIKTHDLTYQFSDDHRVWRNGQASKQSIDKTIVELTTTDNAALNIRTAATIVGAWNAKVEKELQATYGPQFNMKMDDIAALIEQHKKG